MTPDVKVDVDDDGADSEITEQDYIDARARHAGRETLIPEVFAHAATGNGVTGDTLLAPDHTDEESPDDAE